jgi:DNA gyrase subunit B
LRDSRVVDLVCEAQRKLDTKADFQDRANLEELLEAMTPLKVQAAMQADEEHSAHKIVYRDATNADRTFSLDLAARPEYRRMRTVARLLDKYNRPPFTVVKETSRQQLANWRELLAFVKSEGMKDVNIQRYKGLGEMNAGQLWDTTMNAEVRTLLRVELRDLVESDEIFSTLMGEDVENRRKFIEENALDVRNLDV